MKIVENGKAVCGIVLPKEPTPRELFAAQELISYVERISGARLEITDSYANKIIIGEPDKNPMAAQMLSQTEFDAQVPGPEGFMILAQGDSLLLAGSSKNPNEKERGTVYSVYYFLEQLNYHKWYVNQLLDYKLYIHQGYQQMLNLEYYLLS